MNLIEVIIYITVLSMLILGSIFSITSSYFSETNQGNQSYILYRQI